MKLNSSGYPFDPRPYVKYKYRGADFNVIRALSGKNNSASAGNLGLKGDTSDAAYNG